VSRSLAARSPIGLLARPLGLLAPRTHARPATGAARRAALALSLLREHKRLRVALLGSVIALPLMGGAWLWVRSSPLVAVEHVRLSGVHGPEAQAIEAALVGAARHMSTLEVRPGALHAAVAPFRVVREVRATPSFPHGLRIDVLEQLPVAALTVGASRTAVAADGVVLGPALLSSSLPTLAGALQLAPGEHVRSSSLLAALAVLGAAPTPLVGLVARSFDGPRGLTVAMRDGLLVYFGDASRPHAKWLSLARVLADPSSAGASYVDVRLPERPAAGFPAGVSPSAAASTPTSGEQAAGSESTIAALAAGLTAEDGGAASASTGAQAAGAPASEPSAASTPSPQATAPTPEQNAATSTAESTQGVAQEGVAAANQEH
jgi:cell division protein FtsQ